MAALFQAHMSYRTPPGQIPLHFGLPRFQDLQLIEGMWPLMESDRHLMAFLRLFYRLKGMRSRIMISLHVVLTVFKPLANGEGVMNEPDK